MDIELKDGDLVDNSRYRVYVRLGRGDFSTVWLANDTSISRNVVLKFGRSGERLHEAQVYHELNEHGSDTAVPEYHFTDGPVIHCFGEFFHGDHHVLVFELFAITLEDFSQEFNLSLQSTKRILKQILIGLHTLHSKGYSHGDVQDRNILLASRDLSVVPIDMAFMSVRLGWNPVLKVGMWDTQLHSEEKLRVKLADLGSAYRISEPPSHAVSPLFYRSPEDILSSSIDHKIDIWCFGLVMYKFLTAQYLFTIWPSLFAGETLEDWNDRYLLQMIDIRSELPDEMMIRWSRRQHYFLALTNSDSWFKVGSQPQAEHKIRRGTPVDVGVRNAVEGRMDLEGNKQVLSGVKEEQEIDAIISILRKCLAVDKSQRPEAKDLLQEPFFIGYSHLEED